MRSRSTLLVTLAIIAGGLGAAGPAHGDRFELGLGASNHFLASASVDALAEDGMMAGSLSGAMRLPWLRVGEFDALVELALDTGSLTGESFRTMRSDTSLRVTTAGLRIRRPLWWRVVGHASAGLGVARVSLELEDTASRVESITDASYATAGYLGAGGDLLVARVQRGDGSHEFALGLRVELGYQMIAPVSLLGTAETGDEDVIRIPAMATGLGELDMSGWTLRFGVVTRF